MGNCIRVKAGCDNIAMRVEGEGPAVLMLHGWTLNGSMWNSQIDALKDNFRLIIPDRRGHGRSDICTDATDEIDDLQAVLDAVEAQDVALIGMSQGGRIALRFALAFPERVRRLILLAPSADGITALDDPEAIPVNDYAAMVRQGQGDIFRRSWLEHPLMRTNNPEIARQCVEMLESYNAQSLLVPKPDAMPGAVPDFSGLKMPVLIITGAKDTASSRHVADRLAEIIPGACHEQIEGAGHLVNMTDPALVNMLIKDFL